MHIIRLTALFVQGTKVPEEGYLTRFLAPMGRAGTEMAQEAISSLAVPVTVLGPARACLYGGSSKNDEAVAEGLPPAVNLKPDEHPKLVAPEIETLPLPVNFAPPDPSQICARSEDWGVDDRWEPEYARWCTDWRGGFSSY